jgi:RNA polymerase sporulation-specific sigma factor
MSPEESMLSQEKVDEILHEVNNKLSAFEKSVLKIYVDGYNYVEIAQKLKKEPKSIDNALNRIKIKLKYLRK